MEMEELFANVELGTMISCPVCRDYYNLAERTPINVPCGHTFCSQCADSLLPANTIPILMCPVCRKRHFVREVKTEGGGGAENPNTFPKNYQLVEVIEKLTESKRRIDVAKAARRKVECRECKKVCDDDCCTTCSCVVDIPNGDMDFMGRSKNMLICIDCINTTHTTHDVKPMDYVKSSSDNYQITCDLDDVIKRVRVKAESTQKALENAKEELASLVNNVDKTMNRLNGKPKDGHLYCTATKYLKRLGEVEKEVGDLGIKAQKFAAALGKNTNEIKEIGNMTRPKPVNPTVVGIRMNANQENNQVVVRFADGPNVERNVQQIVNVVANVANDEGGQAENAFNDLLQGIFDVIEDVEEAPPVVANNMRIEVRWRGEEGDNNRNNDEFPIFEFDGAREEEEDEEVDVVAAEEDLIFPEDEEPVDEMEEEIHHDPIVVPIVERVEAIFAAAEREAELEAPQEAEVVAAPVPARRRGRPARVNPERVVAVAEAEPMEPVRRGRGRAARHDPIQREEAAAAPNARPRRAARRN